MSNFTNEFSFGFDLDQIAKVMEYVKSNYSANDYKMWIGRGDDVMNALEINMKEGDNELLELIAACEGEGMLTDEEVEQMENDRFVGLDEQEE